MLLAIDAGNTNVTFAVYAGSGLRIHWRISTQAGRTADEYTSLLDTLFGHERLTFADIDGVIIASVVPGATSDLMRLSVKSFGCEPVMVTSSLDMGIKVLYQPPGDVGADRLVDAVAAIAKYGPAPLIVIDFGTATTFNAVGQGDIYLGGAILPGVSLAWDSLFTHAARLSAVPREKPPHAIGASTPQALQSGMTYGLAALVDGMVARFREQMNAPECPVIATGGHAADFLNKVESSVTHVDPILTLEGLRLVWERCRGAI
ncbi:MAG: type III pantothenate kinase [Capsulimonadaceae bacterium]|nr:type III pantothenate kinase [Capsulimonadaceae bacterium]